MHAWCSTYFWHMNGKVFLGVGSDKSVKANFGRFQPPVPRAWSEEKHSRHGKSKNNCNDAINWQKIDRNDIVNPLSNFWWEKRAAAEPEPKSQQAGNVQSICNTSKCYNTCVSAISMTFAVPAISAIFTTFAIPTIPAIFTKFQFLSLFPCLQQRTSVFILKKVI